jgi:hypothetical protein
MSRQQCAERLDELSRVGCVPDDLLREPSLAGTVTLTSAGVTALRLRLIALVDASARVDRSRLADDITIGDQLAKVLAWKGRKENGHIQTSRTAKAAHAVHTRG